MDKLKEIIAPLDDPYKNSRKNQEESEKAILEIQRLCYETFHAFPDGKRLYEFLRDKYLMSACFNPNDPKAEQLAMYWEGFRECIRGIYQLGNIHAKRIAEVNK